MLTTIIGMRRGYTPKQVMSNVSLEAHLFCIFFTQKYSSQRFVKVCINEVSCYLRGSDCQRERITGGKVGGIEGP
jgi:hypothetical protein